MSKVLTNSDLKKIDLMNNQWYAFLSARKGKHFEINTAPNWLTMNERENIITECLRILTKLVREHEDD